MKQHYKRGIYALLFLLLTAAYVVKMQRQTAVEPISGNPVPKNSKRIPDQQNVVHDSTITSIQQSLAKREYNISLDTEKNLLQSPNRKQRLRAYYKPGELTVNNRVDSAGHNFSLKLVNEGILADGKKIFSAQANAVSDHIDNKLVIKHKGFSEEFINNEEGVRQNFIIDSAPEDTKELQVKLSAIGLKVDDLQNNELHFFTENKNGEQIASLIYKDVNCWDADGKVIPATLRYEDGLVKLSVNVQDAAYPVTIDPIVVNGNPGNANATVEGNQAGAWMGGAVSSAGDVNGDGYSDILVSASKYDNGQIDEGAVFVYHGTASGIDPAAVVMLEGDQKEARFGSFVSSAGDINKDGFSDIVVGALFYDKGQTNEGAAFIYYGSAQGINKAASLVLESNQPEANMGNAVGMAGDVNGDGYSDVAVCARAYDNGQANEGVVFIYHGSAAGLNVNPVLIEQNQPESMFGFCATGAGDVNGDGYSDLVVGARTYDKGQTDEGAVFVYHGSALGLNTAAATILESNQANAYLGHTVASAGDVNGDGYSDIILGANMYDKGQTNEGVAFVHYGSGQGVSAAPAVVLEKNQVEAQLGYSVASAGDVNGDGYADVIVGAMYYDNDQSNEGAAFIYQGSSTGLSANPVSTLESNQAGAQFGSNVSSAGDVNGDGYSDVVVGAIVYDNGHNDEGAAFVWLGKAEGVNSYPTKFYGIPYTDGESPYSGNFGQAVTTAGDINGDGFGDIIICDSGYDNGVYHSYGGAFIYYGSPQGIDVNSVTIIDNIPEKKYFGESVASAGDVNGDGYDDIIIGDTSFEENHDPKNGIITDGGGAFVYYGSSQGINKNNPSILRSVNPETNREFAESVAGAGDVNGDGYDDVVVGDSWYTNPVTNQQLGATFVYYGSAQGINTNVAIVLEGKKNSKFGGSVACAGDINGDGFDDIIAGAANYNGGSGWVGAAYLFYGSALGITNNPTILEGSLNEFFGESVSGAGDINGDGFADIAIGCPKSESAPNFDAVFAYYGTQNGINNNSSKTKIEIGLVEVFGYSISKAGDFNGDGYGDIIVGAPNHPPFGRGAAFLYFGSPTGVSSLNLINFYGDDDGVLAGTSVSSAGDVNGDGYSDVLIGSMFAYAGNAINGATLYKGNNGAGVRNNPRLYNSNLTTPINQSQKAQTNFGASLYARSFLGRNKGKLLWETKAKGEGFSKGSNNVITTSTQSTSSQSAYLDLGIGGVELKNLVDKQGPSTKIRVRVKYDRALALTGQLYGPWRYLPAYLVGNNSAPAPEDVVDNMSETVKRKAVSVESFKDNVRIYPNPVSDKLFIETENPELTSHIQLYTSTGKSVCKTVQNHVDVKGFESGVYILVISRKDGTQTSHKVAINR
ncbi:FG-GAP-like repeat-containing protein [Dyadobacter sp. CY326]|uniref:FG-GAP-like repeat-containing protein n=1 Tax=Dyadobacter sp. CY326 TaxID=2907300 RepID=UPI001F371976|nr:FG-GAP-like repeat-containing protein [Dyadobacter sp. CY326]MCE7066293.1 FG-GAP-like repeat-containing protein [Dyadobacter sp. CY326]